MIKIFFSQKKNWIEECVLNTLTILLNNLKPGKTEFMYNNEHIFLFYMNNLEELEIQRLFEVLVEKMVLNYKDIVIYNDSDTTEIIEQLIGNARHRLKHVVSDNQERLD